MKKILIPLLMLPLGGAFGQAATSDALVGTNTTIMAKNSMIQTMEASKTAAEAVKTTAQLTTMGKTLVELKQMEEKLQKALAEIEWAKNLKTVKTIYSMVETIVCTYQDLQVLGLKSGSFGNCIFSFKYQFAMLKLQAAVDMLTVLLTSGRTLTGGERMESLDNAINQFGEAHALFGDMLADLNGREARKAQFKAISNGTRKYNQLSLY
jgi:hypothetical protein